MSDMTHTPTPVVTGITAIEAAGGHTVVSLADGRVVALPVTVNRASAERLQAAVRRLSSIEIDTTRRTAVAVGTGHRRPFERTIPVSMALGLLALGVPGVAS